MSLASLRFGRDLSTEQDIRAHLLDCDERFDPRLSARVDIGEYAKKIRAQATTFEAWNGGTLVGLVAAYVDTSRGTCYITSVSVLADCAARGIATRLVEACLAHAGAAGIETTSLEVSAQSAAALRIYEKLGFREYEKRAGMMVMRHVRGAAGASAAAKHR